MVLIFIINHNFFILSHGFTQIVLWLPEQIPFSSKLDICLPPLLLSWTIFFCSPLSILIMLTVLKTVVSVCPHVYMLSRKSISQVEWEEAVVPSLGCPVNVSAHLHTSDCQQETQRSSPWSHTELCTHHSIQRALGGSIACFRYWRQAYLGFV